MKKLLLLLALSLNLQAADSSFNIAANTPNNVGSTNHWIITKVAFTAGGSAAIVHFYDTGAPTTNITTGAYTSTVSFMTNITQITTNIGGIKQTNNFRGLWSVDSPVAGGTAEAPQLTVLSVPANMRLEREVNLTTIKGLTIWSSTAGTAEVQFRPLF